MLMCLTASHKNASFDLLERLSGGAESVGRRITGHAGSAGDGQTSRHSSRRISGTLRATSGSASFCALSRPPWRP